MSEHNSLYENSQYPSRRQPGEPAGSRRPRKKKRRRRPVRRAIGIFFKVLGTLILVGLCTGTLLVCFAAVYINEVIVPIADLSMDDFPLGENSVMYYQDKETGQYREMTTLFSTTSQIWVDYEDMPKNLINAAVAIEDKRFWEHPGVDWRRTALAVFSMFTGRDISGGSTITQQLIKNTTQYNETTVKRKITEIVRAIRFTENNSKEDTIERYLNIIPLGSGCEGVGSAALEYFGKPVSQLTLAECASLVGITNNPSKYGPYSFSRSQGVNTDEIWDARQWNKYRQEVILGQMLKQEYITQAEYDAAVAQELVFVRGENNETETDIYTWYEETVISDVRRALKERTGLSDKRISEIMASGGLRIYTCYDPKAQAIVDEIYTNRENLNYTAKDGSLMQSAIAVMDNATGDIVAIAGQFGEKTVNLGSNYANDGHRQPGSSFKPLAVYSPAIEFNLLNPCSVLDDYPYQLMGGKAWPLNSGSSRYQGRLTMREALKQSLNTVAVRIMSDYVTPEESFHFIQDRYNIDLEEGRMINGELKTDITVSLAMGGLTDGVNVRDMAEAYATFPNGGVYTTSRTFTRVTQLVDGEERLLLDNTLEQEPVIKDTTAYTMNDMLQGVFTSGGTASGRGIKGQHAAGKTGTTSDNKDRWFVGYTPYYTAAVWTGYEQGQKMSLSGVNPALALWQKVMVPLHEGLEDRSYPAPEGTRTLTYCLDTGLIANTYCAMDPRGSRVASGQVLPESFPEDSICTAHTEESLLTICVDCPILDSEGKHTGLYGQAGPYCPTESLRQICYPNYEREQIGSAVAQDDHWRFVHAQSTGLCTVHGEPEPEPEPEPGTNSGTEPGGDPGNNSGTGVLPPTTDVGTRPVEPSNPDSGIRPIDPSGQGTVDVPPVSQDIRP
ncbi:transglycosylase domain-containing protein [Oscillospiraceae bacterium 50-16]